MAKRPARLKPKRNRQSRKGSSNRKRAGLWQWWSLWRTPIFLLMILGVWWLTLSPQKPGDWVLIDQEFGFCGERGRPQYCVSDGDTVTIGYGRDARRIRLTGFDAPEMRGACAAESQQAQRARSALHEWLNQQPFEWSGGADPARDKYGRELRVVRRRSNGGKVQELAEFMIDADLAEGPGPWEGQDWCE